MGKGVTYHAVAMQVVQALQNVQSHAAAPAKQNCLKRAGAENATRILLKHEAAGKWMEPPSQKALLKQPGEPIP